MPKKNINQFIHPLTRFLIPFLLFTGIWSCKAKEQFITETQPKTFLVVSFFSIGMGVNHQAVNTMNNILADYNKTKNVDIPVNKIPWGKEGEFDYCVDYQVLEINAQKEFINKVHTLLDGQNWVRIKENAQCRALQNK